MQTANTASTDNEAKLIAFYDASEAAKSMGFPSLTEALESLDELRDVSRRTVEYLRCRALSIRMGLPVEAGKPPPPQVLELERVADEFERGEHLK